VAMELPPETFEFFLGHDVRPTSTGKLQPFQQDVPTKPGESTCCHVIEPGKALEIVFTIAQADKHFKVCEVGRVRVGNIRDALDPKKVVEASWSALPVAKQGRASESDPWVVQCDWQKLPEIFARPDSAGKMFIISLQSEIQEVERLALEEPLQLAQDIVIKIASPGEAAAVEMTDAEVKRRFRLTSVVQEIYMGQFEVSDAAVNLAMASLRDQSDEGSIDVLAELEASVSKLQQIMTEEAARQFEDLALKTATIGLDLTKQLELWQLPSELLGASAGGAQDAASLKKEVEELKKLLRAANERIAYLESANGATRAQQQISALRKQMLDKSPENKTSANGDPKSKACIIS